MARLPDKHQQIVQAHAALIVGVVQAVQNPHLRPQLDEPLRVSEQNGWVALVGAIRKILAGSRDASLMNGLDEEDTVIVQAILRGLQDPSTLPDPAQNADPSMAAPGLAHMIHQAAHGNADALQMLSHMAEQMTQAGGDMARLGGIMRRLVNGERDGDALRKGMGAQGESLLNSILEELGKLEAH
jgi:hypothetical protein